jgi:hypothetical protein
MEETPNKKGMADHTIVIRLSIRNINTAISISAHRIWAYKGSWHWSGNYRGTGKRYLPHNPISRGTAWFTWRVIKPQNSVIQHIGNPQSVAVDKKQKLMNKKTKQKENISLLTKYP